jgi:glutamine synthetase
MNARDAVAEMYKTNRNVIFTGNGYSAGWPAEAAKRGLPNLNTTPKAIKQWASNKNVKLFEQLGVFSEEETKARAEVMYEAYNTTLSVEVNTMVDMVKTGFMPAFAQDLALYKDAHDLAGNRKALYTSVKTETEKLATMMKDAPHDMVAEAEYLCDKVKEQMVKVRSLVDEAEGILDKGLYPYPTYESMLYHHHH